MKNIVVVGGGHAAAQFCSSMVESGCPAQLALVTDEVHLPYQRPPLSKAYLKDPTSAAAWLRGENFYADCGATWHLAQRAIKIDRGRREVVLASGKVLEYDRLVLATGARARTLPLFQGAYRNVRTLRSLSDAAQLREQIQGGEHVLVVGGGFIGLEIAATAAALGKKVTVLEAAPRLLSRSASPEVSAYLLDKHRANKVDIRLGICVDRVETDAEATKVKAVWCGNEYIQSDVILLGIGAVPNDELARNAGLECDNGIVVDGFMRTSDPDILAIGDCTAFPSVSLGRRIRLESVQNANDQARCAVQALIGAAQPYCALPWFWSEQGTVRLQIAGVPDASDERLLRGESSQDKFSVLYFRGNVLTCVESINAPADHVAARKLIAAGKSLPRRQAADPAVQLRSFD